jgi:hypothetical protein
MGEINDIVAQFSRGLGTWRARTEFTGFVKTFFMKRLGLAKDRKGRFVLVDDGASPNGPVENELLKMAKQLEWIGDQPSFSTDTKMRYFLAFVQRRANIIGDEKEWSRFTSTQVKEMMEEEAGLSPTEVLESQARIAAKVGGKHPAEVAAAAFKELTGFFERRELGKA